MGGTLSPQQWLRTGILLGAFVLGLVSLFTPWWTVAVEVGSSQDDSSARPYDAGDFKDRTDDDGETKGITTETILTGVFLTLSLLAVLAYLVLEALPLAGKAFPALYKMVAAGVAVLFGAVAVIYTATAWPSGADIGGLGFFDSFQSEGFSGFGVNTPGTTLTTYAGFGWYVGILATVVLPAAAFVHGLVKPEAAAPTTPPPPPAPRLAEPVMSAAPPLRTPKLTEARSVARRPAARRK
ncbi:MAG: hypothetical protein HYT80_11245 [Euryarchaeota archaeon]|nr:hypothetical protein [Euryarchaeota archaeon]